MSNDGLDAFLAADEGEADVSELVEELIERAHAELGEKAVLSRSVPFAVRAVTADMLSVVRCFYTECDRGEPHLATATTWAADIEAQPAAIDAWSRGAVPVKRRTPAPAPLPPPSASSAGASRTPRSPRSISRPKSREGEKDGAANAVAVAKAPPKDDGAAAAAAAKKGGPMLTPEELRAQREAKEAKEEQERLETLRAEVKGREYTYDAMGNVIVIETVNPERLPPYQYATRAGMAAEPPPDPKAKKGGKGGGKRGKGGAAAPAVRFNKPGEYQELDSLQPPLNESMTMQEGVSLRQGESLISGPPRAVDNERMSRKDFETFVATAGRAADQATMPSNPLAASFPPSTPLPAIPTTAGSTDLGGESILGGDTANDVNLQLMAKDWGVNPPQRDFSAARRPRYQPDLPHEIGVGRSKLPRERGGTGVAAHLPPPLLPATAGHGLEAYAGSPGRAELPPGKGGGGGAPIRTANPELLQQMLK